MLTDVATGWTEAAPIVVREGTLVVETLERIRVGRPFALTALDVDNGSEFINNRLIDYCLGHGIELTRSRPSQERPQTPRERLLQVESIPAATKDKLREIAVDLDPLKLLEEMRTAQAYLAALADGETPLPTTSEPPSSAMAALMELPVCAP